VAPRASSKFATFAHPINKTIPARTIASVIAFAAEVAAVLVQTQPLLRMIVCDADVHQVQDFSGREGAKLLRGFEFNVTEGPTSGRSSRKRRSGSRIC
jgi:hypothetical protein